ncbi:hypothetical protein MNB_SV-13-770 [hydrothermal vent metagenome]|uniref:Exosortase/archaeosortase family protein n=1 Tax=hydrothermal vent metagenome TaxID=652676 RepID=A0A1W1CZ92_9ZZZZ
MKRFIALYFLYLGFLFTFFVLQNTYVSQILNTFQTNLTLIFLDFFLEENQRMGRDIWIHSNYKIIITDTCNGIIPFLFLTASLWAYPAKILPKTLWTFFGYIILFLVNGLRILWVVYVTKNGEGQEDFYWSHDIVGNAFLMFFGLLLFVGFIKSTRRIAKNKV